MLNVTVFTVSYLNDFEKHVEWFNYYYSSLEEELSGESVCFNHFIFLNEKDKNKAKRNIKKLINNYDLDFYNPVFLKVEVSEVLKKDPLTHHGEALRLGVESFVEDFDFLVKKSDLFLIEEFDVIHKRNYFKSLSDILDVSKKLDTFVGTIESGKVGAGKEFIDDFELPKFDAPGSFEVSREEVEKISYRPPRIKPHFLAFCSNLFSDFFVLCDKFRDEFSPYVRYFFESNDEISFSNDTGMDLLNVLVENNNFLHLKEVKPIFHIKGITFLYRRVHNSTESPEMASHYFKRKLKNIEEKFSYLSIKESQCCSLNTKNFFDFEGG